MADGKVPVCTAGGAPVTKQYVYSLYDAKTGALRAKGTPQELMEHCPRLLAVQFRFSFI